MIKRETGFSLIELLMVMIIIGFVLTAGSEMFINLLRGYKQQSKIAETNIESIIGLEMLRRDLESAGYGLPWSIPAGTTYSEAADATAAAFNDSPASAPPRAVLSGDNMTAAGFVNGSDYLVIKALNVARNDASAKWTYLSSSGTTTWDPSTEDLLDNDRVIVISPGTPDTISRSLTAPTGVNLGTAVQMSGVSGFATPNETRIVYGVAPADGTTPLRMPFNRADYYVRIPATNMPGRCAQGTGILYKAVLSHATGVFSDVLPLLDCVADMQVVTRRDTNGDGSWDASENGLAVADAQTIRTQLKEVHVYILAHEGQRDTSYTHSPSTIWVGAPGSITLGRSFDLAANITNWQNYRWKVYPLIVNPNNLR